MKLFERSLLEIRALRHFLVSEEKFDGCAIELTTKTIGPTLEEKSTEQAILILNIRPDAVLTLSQKTLQVIPQLHKHTHGQDY